MKTFRAKTGPVSKQPYFTDHEIEQICTEELKKVNLLPQISEAIRIERFIEKRFNVTHEYEDLPVGILGYTKFGPNGVERIIVSKSLDDGTDVSNRRLRTTLAHEAGHGLLHAFLFADTNSYKSLFDSDHDDTPRIFCRDIVGSENTEKKKYNGKWWEFHANKAMASLLMPEKLTEEALKLYMTSSGLLGLGKLEEKGREEAIKPLSDIFDVNPIVVRIRIQQLHPLTESKQQCL